jgi:hypothetical protein
MSILKKFFKGLIVDALGTYVEDFTEEDIQIDNWNGVVIKEDCIIKKSALQSIMRSAVGAPVQVQTGFVRNIRIVVPWNQILSKPVEIYLDDVHAICDTPDHFDKEFAQKTYHKAKMQKFEDLIQQFKDQYPKPSKDDESKEENK